MFCDDEGPILNEEVTEDEIENAITKLKITKPQVWMGLIMK